MCEFCHKHGEGKKWYLLAKNYSDDLLSDVRRRAFIREFFSSSDAIARDMRRIDDMEKLPSFIRRLIAWRITRKMKKVHFGQVVPIEDVERIFGFINSIVRVACFCRHIIRGKEQRFCYGVSLAPDGGKLPEIFSGLDKSFLGGPDTARLEKLSKEEAIAAFRGHEREGLCHTLWTFHAPFIGGICNCDRSDCMAMRLSVTRAIPVMFRAEYVAEVNPDACVGCRECMRVCQFGAVTFSAGERKAVIDQRWCYGCGICRSACKKDAIRLRERANVPAAAKLWT
jgi:NAD-dependent dihydropyrimidine dehydrogenase PreA subunit